MKEISSKPLISILVTVYNQIEYVSRALDSILQQDYQNMEIIIGDDCSDDGDVESLVNEYKDSRIRYVRNPVNLGMNANYANLLCNEAKGELASIFNADDYFLNERYLSQVVDLFNKTDDLVLVFGHTCIALEANEEIHTDRVNRNFPQIMEGEKLFLNQVKGWSIPHITSVYRTKLAKSLDFYPGHNTSSDWESFYKLILNGKVGYVSELSAAFGRHNENISKNIDVNRLVENTAYIENSYKYALEGSFLPKAKLDTWRSKMLFRYMAKGLIKIKLWAPEKTEEFLNQLNKSYPMEVKSIRKDIRIKVFDMLKNQEWALRLIFKYVLGQESVLEDLLSFRRP